ncbi:MAG: hypothetical protein ACI3WT_07790 [Phascolarctobacterium sp.]
MIEISVLTLGEGVDFAPASEYTEIIQNVRCIMCTIKQSVPLDRDMGIDAAYVDKPMAIAQAMLADEIISAIQKYEPRVTVSSIDFTATVNGQLIPKVQVTINEEY